MKNKIIIVLTLALFYYSCKMKESVTDKIYECINDNTDDLINRKGNVFDMFKSIENDLIKGDLMVSIDKNGYIEFVEKLKSNENGIEDIKHILIDNFNIYSDYSIAVVNVGEYFASCLNNYSENLDVNMTTILNEYKTFESMGNYSVENLESLVLNIDDDFYNRKENRAFILYLISYNIYFSDILGNGAD